DGIRDFHVTGVQTCALPISFVDLRRKRSIGKVRPFVAFGPAEKRYTIAPLQKRVGPRKLLQSRRGNCTRQTPRGVFIRRNLHDRSEERRVGKEWRCRSEAKQ